MDNKVEKNNSIVEIKQLEKEVIEKEADVLQLHCAAYMGNLSMIKECIEKKGVDVNALARGNTALLCATRANHQHVMEYLIKKGGKIC